MPLTRVRLSQLIHSWNAGVIQKLNVIMPESGPVAQLVEHRTFNAVVPGSSPGRLTMILNHLVDLLEFVFVRVIAQKL
jgi:hypothetical protein